MVGGGCLRPRGKWVKELMFDDYDCFLFIRGDGREGRIKIKRRRR